MICQYDKLLIKLLIKSIFFNFNFTLSFVALLLSMYHITIISYF